MHVTKQEFIEKLAKKAKISKKDARSVVDAAIDLIVDRVKKKEKVTLTGFGTFEARQQKATQRINPQTGRKMTVPAKLVPKFRPGKQFKEALAKRR
jgi:DNA-binding protein HU-beta